MGKIFLKNFKPITILCILWFEFPLKNSGHKADFIHFRYSNTSSAFCIASDWIIVGFGNNLTCKVLQLLFPACIICLVTLNGGHQLTVLSFAKCTLCRWTLLIRQLRDVNFGVCIIKECNALVGSKVFWKLTFHCFQMNISGWKAIFASARQVNQ